jgi:uncharacterized pyridoxamine 5'-phosphate oxidase family protein
MTIKYSHTMFSADDIQQTQPEMKIGLLATVNPEGKPHVTLLSSLMACGEKQLVLVSSPKDYRKNTCSLIPKPAF